MKSIQEVKIEKRRLNRSPVAFVDLYTKMTQKHVQSHLFIWVVVFIVFFVTQEVDASEMPSSITSGRKLMKDAPIEYNSKNIHSPGCRGSQVGNCRLGNAV